MPTKPATPLLACAPGGLLFYSFHWRYGEFVQRPFSKPAKSINEQIALIESRGMIIDDVAMARHALQHISYYRLRAYWLYFENGTDGCHSFKRGTQFSQVIALYDFDRRLRLTIMDAIERIEVATRGAWAHHMAMNHGPHGHLEPKHYNDPKQVKKNVGQLRAEVRRSQDTFMVHYRKHHISPEDPPVWMASELMSFGLLSKYMKAMKQRHERNAISRVFGLDEKIFLGFLHHLVTLRNICAHHGRLWNRQFTVTPKLPRHPNDLATSINQAAPRNIYNSLGIMLYLIDIIQPNSQWRNQLKESLIANPTEDFSAMGFPEGWQEQPIWK